MVADIRWDNSVTVAFLEGNEYRLLVEIVPEIAAEAQMLAPVRTRHRPYAPIASRLGRGIGHPPGGGRLKASVTDSIEKGPDGWHGDVISLWYGRFLDPKARQLHRLYPFLPTAMYTVLARWFPDLHIF